MLGSLFKENIVVCERVRVSFEKKVSPSTCNGFVYLPPCEDVEPGLYELRLEDGTARDIEILSINGGVGLFRGPEEWF
jgi:hypothetical protein